MSEPRIDLTGLTQVDCPLCSGKGGYQCWDCRNCNGHGYVLRRASKPPAPEPARPEEFARQMRGLVSVSRRDAEAARDEADRLDGGDAAAARVR